MKKLLIVVLALITVSAVAQEWDPSWSSDRKIDCIMTMHAGMRASVRLMDDLGLLKRFVDMAVGMPQTDDDLGLLEEFVIQATMDSDEALPQFVWFAIQYFDYYFSSSTRVDQRWPEIPVYAEAVQLFWKERAATTESQE